MKNIIIFSSLYLPHLGGVERYTSNLAKHLIKLGNHVTVVTSKLPGEQSIEVMESVNIIRLKSFNLLNGRFPIYDFRHSQKDKNILRNIHADLIIINTRYYPLSLFAAEFAKEGKIKCILIDHSTGHISFNNALIDRFSELYEHAITSKIKKYNVDFYGVSKNTSRWLKHFEIQSKGEIYNAIDLEMIETLKKNVSQHLNNVPFQKYSRVICFTGRLIKEKGILELIEGFKIYNKQSNSCLVIAGEGPLLESLKEKNIKDVFFLGKISFEEVVSLLCKSDVFCFPTAYPEGFPTSLLEAAACHCYLISTDKGGARELIKDSSYGHILKTNAPYEISRALSQYDKIENINSILEKTYSLVKQEFDWKVIAKKVSDCLID